MRSMNLYKKTAHELAPHTPGIRLNTDLKNLLTVYRIQPEKSRKMRDLPSFFNNLSILKLEGKEEWDTGWTLLFFPIP